MRKFQHPLHVFSERRRRLAESVNKHHPGAAVIVAANPESIRNHDVHYPYRQDSNLYYLTGFEEPESILIFRPGATLETVLFVRQRNVERETWDGFRYGPENAQKEFGVDRCYPIEDFAKEAPKLLGKCSGIYYRLYKYPTVDRQIKEVLLQTKAANGRTGIGILPIYDADVLIGELRLHKSPYDLDQLGRACEISAAAHVAAMKFTRPGVNERQVQAVLYHHFLMNGAAREGYSSIVASGNGATTLHYNFNDQICKSGDLLLIDAGAEYNYFTGDITRTFPINGKFTDAQAKVYEAVLKVQKDIIAQIKPGLVFKDLHDLGTQLLTDVMLDLGLLTGRKNDIIESLQHKKYYPHGIGHWLGMDVHDAGLYFINEAPRPIEENMCFTIEPGIYIPLDDDTAPEKFRGIGIRIEDNIRVTASGCENMTAACPKEINDLERIIGQS